MHTHAVSENSKHPHSKAACQISQSSPTHFPVVDCSEVNHSRVHPISLHHTAGNSRTQRCSTIANTKQWASRTDALAHHMLGTSRLKPKVSWACCSQRYFYGGPPCCRNVHSSDIYRLQRKVLFCTIFEQKDWRLSNISSLQSKPSAGANQLGKIRFSEQSEEHRGLQ